MARCAYNGTDEGASLKAPKEDVRREDGVGVRLVFCVRGMGPKARHCDV